MARLTLVKAFPYLLIIGGAVGLIASLILSHDTLAVAQNSHYVPSCNLNPVLSCGSVINAPGDKILGLPYPFYGIGVFAVLIGAGAGLLAGGRYRRWYWLVFQLMMTLGTIGAYLLLLKSIFKIHALCPFCLSVDVTTTILFWYTTLYNFDLKTMPLSGRLKPLYRWVRRHHLDLLVLWFIIVAGLILKHFWYYYGQHL